MRRLQDSCRDLPHAAQAVLDDAGSGGRRYGGGERLRHCYLRPIVVRTGEQMGVYAAEVPVETFIIAWNWGRYLGDDALEQTASTCACRAGAAPRRTRFPTLAKAGGNYLNSQLSKMEARLDGYAEGIMLDTAGHVSEGSGENLFVVRDGVIYTASLGAGILSGITRDSVMRHRARPRVRSTRGDDPARDAVYRGRGVLLGTAAEITPIRSVDRIQVGTGSRVRSRSRFRSSTWASAKARSKIATDGSLW